MRIITKDDFIDVYHKVIQRGLPFILSKFNANAISRTKSAFDNSAMISSNWWIIPSVKKRWNKIITGNAALEYEAYTVEKHFKNKNNLQMLSIGSGVCSHELKFATYDIFKSITCVDIAENLLQIAEEKAKEKQLHNIEFIAKDIESLHCKENEFDIILFNSSLHHFSKIEQLLTGKIRYWLRPEGKLIINEYVGVDRLQFNKEQIQSINDGLKIIPERLKKRYKTNMKKNSFSGSGYLRMVIADPSECIESSKIIPTLRSEYKIIEERGYGGNLLMNILKDISHNFLDSEDKEIQRTLEKLFDFEDQYLKNHESDFIFGIYENKK